MNAWITLSKHFFANRLLMRDFSGFIFTKFLFISIIYLRSIFFELLILFIFMLFVQVYLTTFTFTRWIFRTISLLISITFVVWPMPKRSRCFFRTNFSASVKLFSFSLFLGLNCSWIGYFLIVGVSLFFFPLFLQGIQRISGVTLDKFAPFQTK